MSDETQAVLDRIEASTYGSTHWEGCEKSHLLCACHTEITRLTRENAEKGERLDHQSEVLAKQSSELVKKDERIRGLENTAIRDERSFSISIIRQERDNYRDKLTTQSAELTRLRSVRKAAGRAVNIMELCAQTSNGGMLLNEAQDLRAALEDD